MSADYDDIDVELSPLERTADIIQSIVMSNLNAFESDEIDAWMEKYYPVPRPPVKELVVQVSGADQDGTTILQAFIVEGTMHRFELPTYGPVILDCHFR